MNIPLKFCLSGCGYLQLVFTIGSQCFAKIKVINQFDSSKTNADEILIESVTTDITLVNHLEELDPLIWKRKNIIVRFEAEYMNLLNVHSGLTTEDPKQMIAVQCRLLHLGECYVDGKRFHFEPLLKVA